MRAADREALLRWYRKHARDLPWRRTRDPWAILVSELLLQQTRVTQAEPYYRRILARFPRPEDLARAELSELLSLWQGAGYYRRAEYLHRAARKIAERGFPRSFEDLLALPGVGRYTAGAVASIAFGEPVPAVDGNARRVLARYYGLENPSPAELEARAAAILDREDPGSWNQALIELGATLCTPQNPRCDACPLRPGCQGKAAPERYPAPRSRKAKAWRLFALYLEGQGGPVLEKRTRAPWRGLFSLPLDESRERLLARYQVSEARVLGTFRYALTHRRIEATLLHARGAWPGTDPQSVPLSTFTRRLLELAEQKLAEPEPGEALLAVAPAAAGAGADGVEPEKPG